MQTSINAALIIADNIVTALDASFEGDRHVAYQDGNGIWTIGYGHTGPEVVEGLFWSEARCLAQLAKDMHGAGMDIEREIPCLLNQNQFDALESFDYNVGSGHLQGSTVRANLCATPPRYQDAADAMLLWDKIRGNTSPGLLRRRQAERALFLKPVD